VAVSLASTTLASSTAPSRCRLVVSFARRMEPLGWRSTRFACAHSVILLASCETNRWYRLNISLELAKHNIVYEDIASKFFEHFIYIADAMTFSTASGDKSLWNEEDGFYYDAIHFGPGQSHQMAVRSLVGLIPLYATLTLEPSVINRFPGFKKRMMWFIENRADMAGRNVANMSRK